MSTRSLHTAVRSLLALALAAALASCGGEDGAPAAAAGTTAGLAADPNPVSPLTGLPLDEVPDHPVLAVKIDNSASSAPQVGLGSAGLVVEELVEGGITRLAAFYYEDVPETVGPVRSMRATDIGVVTPLEAVLVASGGARPTVQRLREAEVTTVLEKDRGYYRDETRGMPYNLFMRLRDLAARTDEPQQATDYLPFGQDGLPPGRPARTLTARFSPSSATSFAFQGGRYVDTTTKAAEGDRFEPRTVVAVEAEVGDAGYRDPAGNPVPETTFDGEGRAWVFTGGRVVRGTWSKSGLDADLRLGAGGRSLQLPPGKVWVALIPRGTGGVTFAR